MVRYRNLVAVPQIALLPLSRGTVWKRAGLGWHLAGLQDSCDRPDHLRMVDGTVPDGGVR
jgi:hypothetical protein